MDKHKQVGGKAAATSSSEPTQADVTPQSSAFPWLFLAGSALIGVGVGLVTLPSFAQDLGWITKSFAKHGIEGAPIALTGLVFCALWTVGRPRRVAPPPTPRVDRDLLLEQIASDLSIARGGMQDLRVEFVYLKDQVQSAATQRELLESQSDSGEAQSAMFGLAASMDQLAARLEQRIKAQDLALQESIASLQRDVTETGARVTSLDARIEEGLRASADVHHGDGEYNARDERQIDIEGGYRAADDDLEVYVELEEHEGQGLGLLDEMDDLGRHYTAKQSPSIRPAASRQPIAFDIEQAAAPIPSRNGFGDYGVDEKLAALRALMSDPSVRQALEAARRIT